VCLYVPCTQVAALCLKRYVVAWNTLVASAVPESSGYDNVLPKNYVLGDRIKREIPGTAVLLGILNELVVSRNYPTALLPGVRTLAAVGRSEVIKRILRIVLAEPFSVRPVMNNNRGRCTVVVSTRSTRTVKNVRAGFRNDVGELRFLLVR